MQPYSALWNINCNEFFRWFQVTCSLCFGYNLITTCLLIWYFNYKEFTHRNAEKSASNVGCINISSFMEIYKSSKYHEISAHRCECIFSSHFMQLLLFSIDTSSSFQLISFLTFKHRCLLKILKHDWRFSIRYHNIWLSVLFCYVMW